MNDTRFIRDTIVIFAIALGIPFLLWGMDNDATGHAQDVQEVQSGLAR